MAYAAREVPLAVLSVDERKAYDVAKSAQFRARNRERYLAQNRGSQRRRKERDPEGVRAYERERSARRRVDDPAYALKHGRASLAKRRARMQGAGSEPVPVDYMELLRHDPCAYCGAVCGALDHIVPLSAGGPHAADNLAAACTPCNSSKHTRPLLTYLLELHCD